METFLQVLGVIFLAILAVVGAAILWIGWNVWGWWRQLQKLVGGTESIAPMAVPPFRVKLERLHKRDWADLGQAELLAGPLRQHGFADIGLFDATPSGFRLLALVNSEQQAYAVVNRLVDGTVYLDLVSAYDDGTFYSCANSHRVGVLDQPEFKLVKSLPGAGAIELLDEFLGHRPQKPLVPATAENFPALFEGFWAREFDWRIARGGITDEEIRRVAAEGGSGAISSRALDMVKFQWRAAIHSFYHEQFRANFLASRQVTAQEWERIRDRVQFIHDQYDWEELLASMGLQLDGVADDDDDEPSHRARLRPEAERLAAAYPPRQAFERINALLPLAEQCRKIAEISQPIAADVYLAPEFAAPGIARSE